MNMCILCGQQWCQINTLLVCSAMADNKYRGLGESKFTASRGQSTPTAVAQEPVMLQQLVALWLAQVVQPIYSNQIKLLMNSLACLHCCMT